jgi:predicted ATPase
LEVLWHLVEHRGQVVDQGVLLARVWPKRVVTPGTLAVSIAELRRALGDDPKAPRFIQTAHRRGYRFVAPVHAAVASDVAMAAVEAPVLLGREAELSQIEDCYRHALEGRRQVLFVTGETGIGKSTLVDAWSRTLSGREAVWVGRGQCVEHSGAGEAYLALLEALNRLCRGTQGELAIAHLRQHAPGWLAQLSGVLTAPQRQEAQNAQAPVSAQHFQRELADALEVMSAAQPVVLILEDLHWCDPATVEALAVLARRPEMARLLVIGTVRPHDLPDCGHPLWSLKQELEMHGQSQELALSGLDEASVRAFVAARLPADEVEPVAAAVYQRTAGQPLFMVHLTDYLAHQPELGVSADRNALARAAAGLPSGLQQFIEAQIGRLSEHEQQVLEAASAAGPTFAAATVAAALGLSVDCVEKVCEGLVRHEQLIDACGFAEWPDGTLTESYGFRHGLYREVLYRRIGGRRRIQLHRAIGQRLESGHRSEASTLAVELAEHFDQGRDHRRAAHYHRLAGEAALQRYAPEAARVHLKRGLALLEGWPQDKERAQEELRVQVALGVAAIAIDGFAAPAAAYAYGRAHALCRQLPRTPALMPVLCGLWNYFVTRADFPQVQPLIEELAALIEGPRGPECLLPARNALGQTHLFTGAPRRALEQVQIGLARDSGRVSRHLIAQYGEDPLVVCQMYAALADWLLGHPERALRRVEAGLRRAEDLAQPFGLAQIRWAGLVVAQGRGDPAMVAAQAEHLIRLCESEDIGFWLAGGRVLQGWALAEQGQREAGIDAIHQGLEGWAAFGTALIRPYNLALLAEAEARRGRIEEALRVVAEAIETAQVTGERWYEAELHRLRAVLLLKGGDSETAEAEAGLRRALALARQQGARALELRAAVSLAVLWSDQARRSEALELLAPVYGGFAAGFDTADLRRARTLLDGLARDVRVAVS